MGLVATFYRGWKRGSKLPGSGVSHGVGRALGNWGSPSKDGHQPVSPLAHHKPLGKMHIQSVDSRLQPEALLLAEGKVKR